MLPIQPGYRMQNYELIYIPFVLITSSEALVATHNDWSTCYSKPGMLLTMFVVKFVRMFPSIILKIILCYLYIITFEAVTEMWMLRVHRWWLWRVKQGYQTVNQACSIMSTKSWIQYCIKISNMGRKGAEPFISRVLTLSYIILDKFKKKNLPNDVWLVS